MASKVADVIEGVKDAVLPALTYKTVVKKFKNHAALLAAAVPGDVVVAADGIEAMPFGVKSGESFEVSSVVGKTFLLKGGKCLLAEWFVPQVSRRERARGKIDRTALVGLASMFAQERKADFIAGIDAKISSAETAVAQALTQLEQAQARLNQSILNRDGLKAAKINDVKWADELKEKIISVVDQKMFTSLEMVEERGMAVLVAYTGPIWVEKKPGDKLSKERGEYALKVYPAKARMRILVENVAPGKLPSDVPYNEMSGGVSNICFGGFNAKLAELVINEDWVRVLAFVRAFLEGNRTN